MSQAKSADDCGCDGKGGAVCEHNRMRRPRYFHGMLLDEKDFIAEQQYHAAKRRLLNRMLYGWGVVCGLDLEWKTNQRWVRILPGLAFDCCGNEIWVSEPFDVDLTRLLEEASSRAGEPCADREEVEAKVRYLCLQYHETASDPVPVYVSGGDCREQTCEFSRVQEGFCVRLACDCRTAGPAPAPVIAPPDEPSRDPAAGNAEGGCLEIDCTGREGGEAERCAFIAAFCARSLPCSDCSGDDRGGHCVVIGRVEVTEKGCVVRACTNECRRYVPSARMIQHLAASVATMIDPESRSAADRVLGNPIHGVCELAQRVMTGGIGDLISPVRSLLCGGSTRESGVVEPVGHVERTLDTGQSGPQEEGPGAAEQLQRLETRILEQERLLRDQEERLTRLQNDLAAKVSRSGLESRLTTLEQKTGDLAQRVEGLGGQPAQE